MKRRFKFKVGDCVTQKIKPDETSKTRDLSGKVLKVCAMSEYGDLQFEGIPMKAVHHFFGHKRFEKVILRDNLDKILQDE